MILGDTHGDWSRLNNLINTEQPTYIIQCGDFGYWPHFPSFDLNKIKTQDTKIFWCDGNHEDFSSLGKLSNNQEPKELIKNIFYMPRGSVLSIDSLRFLFIGGAESIDKHQRTMGYDWFPEELITQKDIYELPMIDIDIVISHTCPAMFGDIVSNVYNKRTDPSRLALDTVLDMYNPKQWYFGHWHTYTKSNYKNCNWTCLDMLPRSQCFKIL